MNTSRIRRTVEVVVIAVFLVAIGLPLAGKLLPTQGAFALTENRRPASFPMIQFGPGWGWSIVSFPARFERYWNDSFAFRWYLIRGHSLAKLALGASPSPKAVLGQEGYLYYAAEQSVDYFRAVRPFTETDLTRWRDDLERRQQWLADRGIRYLVVVAPNKETIYPEFMPPVLRPVRNESRLDQLLRELHLRSSIDIVDLRESLRRAKKTQRVYHKTDTHWNDAGALIASREILARLKPWFPEMDIAAPAGSFVSRIAPGGDLARMLALEDRFAEEYIEWHPLAPQGFRKVASRFAESRDVTFKECNGCKGPVVVMNQDSFNANLAPFLAERVSRLVLVDGSRLAESLIEREKPAIVIQEFVERALMCQSLRVC